LKIEKIENDEDEKSCDSEDSLLNDDSSIDLNEPIVKKEKDLEKACMKCLYKDWPQKLHYIKLSIVYKQLKQFV